MSERSQEHPAAYRQRLRAWFRPGGWGPFWLVIGAIYIYFAVRYA